MEFRWFSYIFKKVSQILLETCEKFMSHKIYFFYSFFLSLSHSFPDGI